MPTEPRSILVIRLSSMGDILLATPLLRQLRARYPNARLDMIVDERFIETVLHNPHLNCVWAYSRTSRTVKNVNNLKNVNNVKNVNNPNSVEPSPISSTSPPAYDFVLDLQHNRRSRQLRSRYQLTHSHSQIRTLDKQRWQKLALVYFKHLKKFQWLTRLVHLTRATTSSVQRGAAIIPIAERYRQTAQILGSHAVPDDGRGLEFFLPRSAVSDFSTSDFSTSDFSTSDFSMPVAASNTSGSATRADQICYRIALAPGAQHATKRWLPGRFAEAALNAASVLLSLSKNDDERVEIVVLGGSADAEVCAAVMAVLERLRQASYLHLRSEQINKQINERIVLRDASGATSLFATARELQSASALLCNDTGVMHLAAACQCPLVAIFGSTVREFGFAPFRVRSHVLEAAIDEVPCRPCTHIGRNRCPRGHFHCMTNVSVDAASAALVAMIVGR
jgi:ADP-heptose:LPS heptosyltransferase